MRQETLLDTQKLRHDVDMMKRDHESMVNKLESLEQENHILQITLQQRDTEIERQQELLEYDGFPTFSCLKKNNLSLVVRKLVFGVFDQARHKPGCTATEDD